MTAAANDTPLSEPPGADNMPGPRKDLCHESILASDMVSCYRISWSKADKKLESPALL